MASKFLLFFITIILFISVKLHAEQIYKGRIVGEDRSKIEDILFDDTITKEDLKAKKIDDLPVYEGQLSDIEVHRKPVSDVNVIPDEEIKFSGLEYSSEKTEPAPFERVQSAKPSKPKRMKIIIYNVIGFFILLAIL